MKSQNKVLIIHMICLAFLTIAIISIVLSHGQYVPSEVRFDDDHIQEWDSCWTINYEGNIVDNVELPTTVPVTRGKNVIIRKTLPEKIKEYNCLMLEGRRQDVTVSIGGIQRATFSNLEYRRWGKTSPTGVIIVPIYNTDSMEDVAITISSDSIFSGQIGKVYIGNEKSLVVLMLKANMGWLTLSLLLLIMGIICLVCYGLYSSSVSIGKSMLYLAMFSFLTTIWSLSQSGLRQLFVGDLTSVEAVGNLCCMLIPVSFVLYINYISDQKYKKASYVCLAISLVNFCSQIILQTFFHIGSYEMRIFSLVIYLLVMILSIVVCCIETKRGNGKKYRVILIGTILLLLANISEALFVNQRRFTESYNRSSIGALIFLCCGFVYTSVLINKEQQYKRDLEKSNKAKTLFLAAMSHEIKTPINAVLGMNEMIMRDTSEDAIHEYAASIEEAGKKLLALVNDVLDYSMIDAGKLDIEENKYQLKPLLRDLVASTETMIGEKDIKLELLIDESIPSEYYGDSIRIKQVLSNILSNAAKYTKSGSIIFSIKNIDMQGDDINLLFSVKDTGEGIKQGDIERFMDPFVRIDDVKNSSIEGTGLGLAITQHLLELMGSKLEVKSEYGDGSEFSFVLSQQVVDHAPLGAIKIVAEGNTKNRKITFTAPGAKILAVDDNKMNLKVLSGILKTTKMEITTCLSGKECLELCRENRYDLIFMDHMMPEMDGIETFKKIREDKSLLSTDSPVFVLTANTITGADQMYKECGFDYYLKKPIDVSELNEVVQKYLPSYKILPFEE